MDLDRIEALLKLMREYTVSELSWSGSDGESLSLRIGTASADPTTAATVPVAAPSAGPPAAPAPEPEGHTVVAPMVGTFYRSPQPGAPPYVDVGQHVTKGQVLCIIEAMKLMNEIESDVDGTIREILVDNEQPVQFGQPLFRIDPD